MKTSLRLLLLSVLVVAGGSLGIAGGRKRGIALANGSVRSIFGSWPRAWLCSARRRSRSQSRRFALCFHAHLSQTVPQRIPSKSQ